jgi:hypothetical protein
MTSVPPPGGKPTSILSDEPAGVCALADPFKRPDEMPARPSPFKPRRLVRSTDIIIPYIKRPIWLEIFCAEKVIDVYLFETVSYWATMQKS